jgi:hypothetical protein
MSNLYRGPSIDGSYQVSVHLAKQFQRRRFLARWAKNRPIRNKNCLWWPCLLMDRDKMSNLYKEPSIDASYQVSVHLAEGFQEEKIKMWKVNGRRTPSDGKSSHCLWQGELKTDNNPFDTYCLETGRVTTPLISPNLILYQGSLCYKFRRISHIVQKLLHRNYRVYKHDERPIT